jgi:integrase
MKPLNFMRKKSRRLFHTAHTLRAASRASIRLVRCCSCPSGCAPYLVSLERTSRILESLSGVELTLTIVVAATGIRISEGLGLKWEDIDYDNRQINLRRVWVSNSVVDRLKTEDSEAPVPMCDLLADCLRAWQAETTYAQPGDWVFASKKSKGRTPRSGGILAADHLRPAAIAAGVGLKDGQRFGFHNFRHGLCQLARE